MNFNADIRIVKGNDFWLMVTVTDKRGGANKGVDLNAVSDLKVSLIYTKPGALVKYLTPEYFVMSSNTSVVMIKCTDLAIGNYGVEVSYTKNSLKCCGREIDAFDIVYRNRQANMLAKEYEAEETNAIDLKVQVYGIPDEGGDVPTAGKIYYGVTDNLPYSVASVTGLTEMSIKALGKTGVDYKEGQSVVILIPSTSSLKGYQDNGFGEKVAFNEYESGVQVGCNGQEVTIGDITYKVYGQLFLNSSTCYIYIA